MTMPRSMSIRNQLIVLIILMTLLPLSIIIYTAAIHQQHEIDEAVELTASMANQIRNNQDTLLAGADQLAATVSILPVVKHRDPAAVNSLLAKIVTANPQYSNVIIVDRTGSLWASAIPTKNAFSYADRRYFKDAIASGMVSSGEYAIGKISPIPNLSFAYPIKDSSGAVSDVMAVVISLDRYNQLLNKSNTTPSCSILIVDHKGTILHSSADPRLVGRQDRSDLLARMTASPNKGTFEADDNLGIRRIFSYQKLWLPGESSPYMYIRTGLKKDYVLSKARHDLILGAGTLFPAMLFMLGIAICFCKRNVLNKISALLDATQRIAHGDLTVRIPNHGSGGELDELGWAFNGMAQRLQQADAAQRENKNILRQSEEKFSAAFHASPDAITLTLQGDGSYLEVNEGFTAITGYLPEEAIGKSSTGLGIWVNPQDRVQLLRELQENGIVKNKEFQLRRKDETIRTAQMSVRIIEIKGEQCLLGITRDISEYKHLQNELIKTQKLESISVLAGGIAHNFNNVLTGVIGYISYAKKNIGDTNKVMQLLESAEKSSYRAAELARQLLKFSQAGPPVRKPVSVENLIKESVSLFLSGSNATGNIACASHHTILADCQQISQAFNNIVLNAVQAMPDDGVLQVRVDCLPLDKGNRYTLNPGNYVKIVFEDNGCGIKKEDLSKVYDPYFTTKDSGTGLGLSTTHSIISKHGGYIDIASEPGAGTTVSVILPSSPDTAAFDENARETLRID